MDSITQQWIERAKYDLDTAKGMLTIRKYLYAVFMCQQALEKILKAILSHQKRAIYPIHNLARLAQEAKIFDECENKEPGLLAELTPFCIKARYGEYKKSLSELCNRKTAEDYYQKTRKLFLWLIQQIN